MLLHILMIYLYHKSKFIRDLVPPLFKYGVNQKGAKAVIVLDANTPNEQITALQEAHKDQFTFVSILPSGKLCPSIWYHGLHQKELENAQDRKFVGNEDTESGLTSDSKGPSRRSSFRSNASNTTHFNDSHISASQYSNQSQANQSCQVSQLNSQSQQVSAPHLDFTNQSNHLNTNSAV